MINECNSFDQYCLDYVPEPESPAGNAAGAAGQSPAEDSNETKQRVSRGAKVPMNGPANPAALSPAQRAVLTRINRSAVKCFGGKIVRLDADTIGAAYLDEPDSKRIARTNHFRNATNALFGNVLPFTGDEHVQEWTIYRFTCPEGVRPIRECANAINADQMYLKLTEIALRYHSYFAQCGNNEPRALGSISPDTVFVDNKGRLYILPLSDKTDLPMENPRDARPSEKSDVYSISMLYWELCNKRFSEDLPYPHGSALNNAVLQGLSAIPGWRQNLQVLSNSIRDALAGGAAPAGHGHPIPGAAVTQDPEARPHRRSVRAKLFQKQTEGSGSTFIRFGTEEGADPSAGMGFWRQLRGFFRPGEAPEDVNKTQYKEGE